jgi:hypothetical protein
MGNVVQGAYPAPKGTEPVKAPKSEKTALEADKPAE